MRRLQAGAVGLVLTLAGAGPSFAGAVITHTSGLVKLGVNDAGHLNYSDGTAPVNSGAWGVSFDFEAGPGTDYRDATSPGCYCEGWGVSVNGTDAGWANVSGGSGGLTVSPLSNVEASTATSVVELSGLTGLTVTHAYEPSSSPNLYKATVTVTNKTGASVSDVTYRRVMDWDVPPTEFNEWVKIDPGNSAFLLGSNDNGFCTSDPRDSCPSIDPLSEITPPPFTTYFGGPEDHGALFDFGFGSLDDGESVSFNIYYGAAVGEGAILGELGSVGAEVYSLGYSTLPGGDLDPDTTGVVYAFAFAGVGGDPIEPVPEPGTMLLLGSGVTALALRRRRKA